MVHSPKPTVVANRNNQADIRFVLGETIYFGSLEFIADHFGNLSLSPEGNDFGAVFLGMVHNGLPPLHIILEESTDEGDTASVGGGRSDFPISRGCNVVTPTVPIITTPQPEGTPAPLTIPMVPL
jgi:hypothetical protein